MSNTDTSKKAVKPCPRCGSAAGKGNGGSQCLCKKGKVGKAATPGSLPGSATAAPEPCDAPIGKKADKGAKSGDCGCGKK
ncbi:MAG: hypothetical protein KGS72_04065 [Cyanobacteria bacterium REEB67]|nr:hypothetical protein [Cyanobacteria bacterium REEB67]